MSKTSGTKSYPAEFRAKAVKLVTEKDSRHNKSPNISDARLKASGDGKKPPHENSIPNTPLESNSKKTTTKDCETKSNDLPWRSKY